MIVRDRSLGIHDVVVNFVSDGILAYATRFHCAADSRSCNLGLPGSRRAITKVEFRRLSKNIFAGFDEIESRVGGGQFATPGEVPPPSSSG